MIERLLVALAILGALGLAGLIARALVVRRRRQAGIVVAASTLRLPQVIAFSSPGCAACRTQRRILGAVLAEWTGGIEFAYVDAVREPDLARRFGIVVVPTIVVAAPDGRVVGINGGVTDVDRLLTQLGVAAA